MNEYFKRRDDDDMYGEAEMAAWPNSQYGSERWQPEYRDVVLVAMVTWWY